MHATLIENGQLYDPLPRGIMSLLVFGDRIVHCGPLDVALLENAGFTIEQIDAGGCVVLPGLIDVHEHLIGGSGENGFASQTPEITLRELALAGITTVVGCLGVDTITRTPEALLSKVKSLADEGLGAFLYSGGYDAPPVTLTGSVRRDMLLVDAVIGAGEIAISDIRSCQPSPLELARIVSDAYVGGLLTGKAGITHFHVGDSARCLKPLRDLLANHDVRPQSLYPTHVERNHRLLREAAELAQAGVNVDVDVVDADLGQSMTRFIEAGGDLAQLTASSDASITGPRTLFSQLRSVVLEKLFSLEHVLPLVTSNPARILKFRDRGAVRVGARADMIIAHSSDLGIEHVFCSGRRLVCDGRFVVREKCMEASNREIVLRGEQT